VLIDERVALESRHEDKLMPLKIIVVDDEPESLKFMRSLTNALGHYVQTFDNSQEAWQCVEKKRFDVAFVTMCAFELEGPALVRRIRSSHPNGETTIIMLSATANIDSLRKAFGEGADFVLTKPVLAARLRAMLMAMEAPDWRSRRRTARLPMFTDVICRWNDRHFPLRSVNISESGMLLQPSVEIAVGQEVELEFRIGETPAALHVLARIARKEVNERVAVAFIGLAPEEQNAIQLYVLGRLRDNAPRRDHLSDIGMPRFFRP
jgi:CheY-like chemotaxis protein